VQHILRNTLIACILIAFVVFAFYAKINLTSKTKNISSPVSSEIQTVAQSEGTGEKTVTATSLDGGKKITMKKLSGEGEITEYSFSIDENLPFFIDTLSPNSSMSLTYNSWSPNDKYVYIAVNKNGVKDAYVFNSSGENFNDGRKFLSVQDYFETRNIGYKFEEATGWGGQNLLQIKTLKDDGAKGSNFWFEIPSGALIQLAH
jgi:hypothetical protein